MLAIIMMIQTEHQQLHINLNTLYLVKMSQKHTDGRHLVARRIRTIFHLKNCNKATSNQHIMPRHCKSRSLTPKHSLPPFDIRIRNNPSHHLVNPHLPLLFQVDMCRGISKRAWRRTSILHSRSSHSITRMIIRQRLTARLRRQTHRDDRYHIRQLHKDHSQ